MNWKSRGAFECCCAWWEAAGVKRWWMGSVGCRWGLSYSSSVWLSLSEPQVECVPAERCWWMSGLLAALQRTSSDGRGSVTLHRHAGKSLESGASRCCCLHNKSKPSGSTAARSVQSHIRPPGARAHRRARLDSLSTAQQLIVPCSESSAPAYSAFMRKIQLHPVRL